MGNDVLKFSDTENRKFYFWKKRIHINQVDPKKIIIFERFTYVNNDSKYFVSYENNEKIIPMCILMRAYWKNVNDAKTMSFLIEDENYC